MSYPEEDEDEDDYSKMFDRPQAQMFSKSKDTPNLDSSGYMRMKGGNLPRTASEPGKTTL